MDHLTEAYIHSAEISMCSAELSYRNYPPFCRNVGLSAETLQVGGFISFCRIVYLLQKGGYILQKAVAVRLHSQTSHCLVASHGVWKGVVCIRPLLFERLYHDSKDVIYISLNSFTRWLLMLDEGSMKVPRRFTLEWLECSKRQSVRVE